MSKKEEEKMNTIVKVGKSVYREFKSRAVLNEQSMSEALECAMILYNKKAKEVQK